ncbi:MAG: hypothetical protein QM809_00080 [Gordonia sp. (in: high G+C Gram-positive bacteria)]|uniref:hypothetical protein n=1 Tax=Gordonia sp. (in: high G+C Gram-positive bacteria) TaxID=84139 RepID=UPI0039E4FDFB
MAGRPAHDVRRRHVLRRAAATVLVAASVFLTSAFTAPGTACACSCVAPEPEEGAAEATAIVVGRMLQRREHSAGFEYLFQVERSYKKAVPQRIVIRSGFYGGDCGIGMERGGSYRFVVDGAGTEWTAHLCANLETEEVIEFAGPPIRPLPPAADGPDEATFVPVPPHELSEPALAAIILGSVAGTALLGTAGILLTRRFGRRRG